MDFHQNCFFGKFQPSQLVCTPRSKRCKKDAKKTVCANHIQQFYRVVQSLCVSFFLTENYAFFTGDHSPLTNRFSSTLREKSPNAELFLVGIFLHSD